MPIELREDSHGLWIKAQLNLESQYGKEAYASMKPLPNVGRAVVDELSIGYMPVKWEYDKEGDVRLLKEIKLFEFSPVTFAANELALVTGVKANTMAAFRKAQQLMVEIKEGRVLSTNNRALVVKAIDALQALLTASEPGDEPDKSTHPQSKGKGAAIDTKSNEPAFHSLLDQLKTLQEAI